MWAPTYRSFIFISKKNENLVALFYGWGLTDSRLEPLRGGSILFTTKFPEIPGTHFIDLEGWKAESTLEATQWFWTRDSWVGNPAPELEYKGRPSKSEWAFFHFRIRFFLKVWFFIQQKAWILWLWSVTILFKVKIKEKSHTLLLPDFRFLSCDSLWIGARQKLNCRRIF